MSSKSKRKGPAISVPAGAYAEEQEAEARRNKRDHQIVKAVFNARIEKALELGFRPAEGFLILDKRYREGGLRGEILPTEDAIANYPDGYIVAVHPDEEFFEVGMRVVHGKATTLGALGLFIMHRKMIMAILPPEDGVIDVAGALAKVEYEKAHPLLEVVLS